MGKGNPNGRRRYWKWKGDGTASRQETSEEGKARQGGLGIGEENP